METLPENFFSNQIVSTELYLRNNSLTPLPSTIFKNNKNPLHLDIFDNLIRLEHLELQRN